MTDKPIIFSGPMVRALLAGRKTQTRRIIEPEPASSRPREGSTIIAAGEDFVREVVGHFRPKWLKGDRLYVREAFSGPREYDVEKWPPGAWFAKDPIWYWADGNPADGDWTRPRPSIHMPRWASRLTLLVTDVRVERLQDISEANAEAEGTPCYVCEGAMDGRSEADCHCFHRKATAADFRDLWNSIHGPEAWDVNPWVAAISFDVIRANIDAPSASPALPQEDVRR